MATRPAPQATKLDDSADKLIGQLSQNINSFLQAGDLSFETIRRLQIVGDHILNARLPYNTTAANASHRNRNRNNNNNNNYQHQHSPTNTTNNNNNNKHHAHNILEVDDHKENKTKKQTSSSTRTNRRGNRNKNKYGDPSVRTDDEIKDRLNKFLQYHRMSKYLEQADENKFDNYSHDKDGNRQITVAPRLVVKGFYRKNKPDLQSHRTILDALWSINGYNNPFIYLEPESENSSIWN